MAEEIIQLCDRIRATASDRLALYDKLILAHYDPTALERHKHYTRELSLQTRSLRKQVDDVRKTAEGARKEQDRRNSALHILSDKFRRKSADARADAERRNSEVIQHGFKLEQELHNQEDHLATAQAELKVLEAAQMTHNSLMDRLDPLYEEILVDIKGYGQRDHEFQQPAIAARIALQQAEEEVRIEDGVMDDLRSANSKYKSMVGPFADMLGSSQWQGWTMSSGASGTFANEDENMGKILAIVEQGDARLEAARARQPKVQAQPIAVDTQGTPAKHLFRKLVWDPAYLTRMEAYVNRIRQSESILRNEIDNSYHRKRDAEEDLFTYERDLSRTRQKLVEDRESMIREICH